MFVGSTHGEGASTVVATFGAVLATSGEQVLLVDANLRKPALHNLFSVDRTQGVTELLLGLKDVKEVKKRTRFDKLSVITSGVPPSNPGSLLSAKNVCSMIEQMKRESEWVLIDAAPLNEYNDAMVFCSEVDGAVLIVKAEETRWEVAERTKQRLDDAGVRLVGAVLNRRKMYIPEWLYRRL